jgi:hypothetical protein
LICESCVEPFEIKESATQDLLVVDGFISSTFKNHTVKLSRTSPLHKIQLVPEQGASVTIVNNGVTITLLEVSPGIYETSPMAGVIDEKYQLFITTKNGREYASDEVTLKKVPEITDIYAKYVVDKDGSGNGIEIYVDTKDESDKTHFYRWDYIETYEIQSPLKSNYVWIGGNEVVDRTEDIHRCWASDTLENVLIKSTVGLDEDKVVGFPIRYIPQGSYIFGVKYSILVSQYALSEDAYLFWENLRIMNENAGSLSDIQPGTIPGNIYSVSNPDETVLGYFDASAIQERRVFFDYKDFLDDGYERPGFLSGCLRLVPVEAPEQELGAYMERYKDKMLIWDAIGFSPFPVTFLLMPAYCCDCRFYGSNVKPPFWD